MLPLFSFRPWELKKTTHRLVFIYNVVVMMRWTKVGDDVKIHATFFLKC